ncbi:3-oxoacyl-[acyl-carrier-protein] synthase III C-terminal domain-containing protein [Vibrio ruber]|uniref:3-oxoacyl-[acyl-carrier-protein] synthase III C-terminal domain-containing protein n=1 Tax=Vibrio ruber TaxID=184755 RepID=UPI002892A975|nr:3-oxoacyl-[acyl-carrier-protein] synthase III C-terminal domain-containing protein [Vibrio ruber]WNJ94730.1 3-oxoacyl-[acyl-carrier-protein] synthase III C-terminal domain-containing protein [Vibrio ruber]
MQIQRISTQLPEQSISLVEQCELFELTSFKALIYKKFIGVEQIPVARPGEIDVMLEKVIREAIPEGEEKSVHVVIHAHTCPIVGQYGQITMPRILRRLGLYQAFFSGICANRCASFFDAIDVIRTILEQRKGGYGILVTGESALTQELRVVENTAVAGDAAGALLFSYDDICEHFGQLLAYRTHIFGQYSQGVWLENELRSSYEQSYQSMMKDVISATLSQGGVSIEQLRWIVPHSVNRKSWLELADAIHFERSRIMLDNIAHTGHCFGSDMMLNLQRLIHSNSLAKGDHYLMLAVGLGGSFGAALFRH